MTKDPVSSCRNETESTSKALCKFSATNVAPGTLPQNRIPEEKKAM
jgi:hypothetical protein